MCLYSIILVNSAFFIPISIGRQVIDLFPKDENKSSDCTTPVTPWRKPKFLLHGRQCNNAIAHLTSGSEIAFQSSKVGNLAEEANNTHQVRAELNVILELIEKYL